MQRRKLVAPLLASLSQSLMDAHAALEYLLVDPEYAALAPWLATYETHLARLYALGAVQVGKPSPTGQSGGSGDRASVAQSAARGAPRLLVVTGGEEMAVDLAALRGAARTGDFTWQRLVNPTAEQLAHELTRGRRLGRPYTWLHLGVHAGEEGLLLADGCVDGVRLSAQVRGVEVLLLAACCSDGIADSLGIVPYVVSFAEDIETGDAAFFSGAFWAALAQGRRAASEPDAATAYGAVVEQALSAALAAASPEIAEFVRRHW